MKRQKRRKNFIYFIICVILFFTYFWLPKIYAGAFYPLKYQMIIIKYAEEYKTDPNLIAALILAESRFNPNANSPAGARGLMQILPNTADSISKQLGEPSFEKDSLYDPEKNIKYGTWYLSYLMNKYKEKEIALTAYNAGSAIADNYIKSKNGRPSETVKYIKVIIEAEDSYSTLYGAWWKNKEQENTNYFLNLIKNKPYLPEMIKVW